MTVFLVLTIIGLCLILLGCFLLTLQRKSTTIVETKLLVPAGVLVCTSHTKPYHAPRGMCAWETDTEKLWWFDGGNWQEIFPSKYYKKVKPK